MYRIFLSLFSLSLNVFFSLRVCNIVSLGQSWRWAESYKDWTNQQKDRFCQLVLEMNDSANPARTSTATNCYTKTNMDANQQLVLFICSHICAENTKKSSLVRPWMERRVGLQSLQRDLELSEWCQLQVKIYRYVKPVRERLAATGSEDFRLDSLHIKYCMILSAHCQNQLTQTGTDQVQPGPNQIHNGLNSHHACRRL